MPEVPKSSFHAFTPPRGAGVPLGMEGGKARDHVSPISALLLSFNGLDVLSTHPLLGSNGLDVLSTHPLLSSNGLDVSSTAPLCSRQLGPGGGSGERGERG